MKFRLLDGTGTVELKYLYEDMDRHGNVRIYVQRRKGEPKMRLRAPPGSTEFMEEYRKALLRTPSDIPATAANPATPHSLRWLIERYFQSAEFNRLAERTRHVRRLILNGLCEQHGAKSFAKLDASHVRLLRDQKAQYPEAANSRVKALRQVYSWAMEAGYTTQNPARDVRYIRTGSGGHHSWAVAEVKQFEDRHPVGTKARLALSIMLFTGARRSDAVRLGPQMEREGWLCFTEVKGRTRQAKARELPILPELRAVIDATPSGHLSYIVTEFGKQYTSDGFGNWFRRRCDEAGLPHCSAHGLRKAGASIAAENGATEHQLMAIYGWSSPKQAALYTRNANRKHMIADAMHKLVPIKK
jgi:integrase